MRSSTIRCGSCNQMLVKQLGRWVHANNGKVKCGQVGSSKVRRKDLGTRKSQAKRKDT